MRYKGQAPTFLMFLDAVYQVGTRNSINSCFFPLPGYKVGPAGVTLPIISESF